MGKPLRIAVVILSVLTIATLKAARAEYQYINYPVSMHIRTDRDVYVLGEPIVVTITIKNMGKEPFTDRWFAYTRGFSLGLENASGRRVWIHPVMMDEEQIVTDWVAAIPPGGSVNTTFEFTRGDIVDWTPVFPRLAGWPSLDNRIPGYVVKQGTYRLRAVHSLELNRAGMDEPMKRLQASELFSVAEPFDPVELRMLSLFEMQPVFSGPKARESQKKALRAYKEIWTTWPRTRISFSALYNAARVHQKRGEWKQAIESYSAIMHDWPSFPMMANVMYFLAMAYESSGEIEKARDLAVTLKERYGNFLIAPDIRRDFKGNPTDVLLERLGVGSRTEREPYALEKLELQRTVPYPLVGDQLTLTRADGKLKNVPVALEIQTYSCTEVGISESNRGVTRTRKVHRFRVYSTDAANPFEWSMWGIVPLGLFRLISSSSGETFVSWLDGTSVQFSDISRRTGSSTQLDAVTSYNAPKPDIITIPIGILVPEVRNWGLNAFYSDITVRSIEKDKDGRWVVQISGPGATRMYTMVSDESAKYGWRLMP